VFYAPRVLSIAIYDHVYGQNGKLTITEEVATFN